MFEYSDAYFIQISKEPIEDGYQVDCSDLITEDEGHLMDWERQGTTNLPLGERRRIEEKGSG